MESGQEEGKGRCSCGVLFSIWLKCWVSVLQLCSRCATVCTHTYVCGYTNGHGAQERPYLGECAHLKDFYKTG